MPFLQPRQEFQPSCPSGGTWYSCGAGAQFVGCCTSEPCTSNGCPQGNLRPASFNASFYGTFPDIACDNGLFYTCAATDPPFMGCCIENACQADGGAGCPLASLAGAHLPDNAAKASAWSPTGGPSSTSAAASSTSSATSSDSSSPVGAIAGGVVGGIAVLLVVVGVLLWRRRRKAKEKAKASAEDSNAPAPVSELSAGRSVRAKGSPLPPRYSAISNSYAFELDGYPRKAPNTPSELGGDEVHAELPGDDAVHELEGSTIASTPASGSGGGGGHSRGSSWSSTEKKQRWSGPRGLAITGWGGHGRSPRSSPRSPNFPQNRGGQEGGDEHTEISSLPSTPRSPYTGTGNYSEVSRLSPTHPPPIIEDEGDDRYDPDMRERRDER